MIDINETIAVSVLNIVLPRLTLMKFFSFIIFFSLSEKSPSGPTIKLIFLFFYEFLISFNFSTKVLSEFIKHIIFTDSKSFHSIKFFSLFNFGK